MCPRVSPPCLESPLLSESCVKECQHTGRDGVVVVVVVFASMDFDPDSWWSQTIAQMSQSETYPYRLQPHWMLTLRVLLENAKEPDIAVFGNYVKLLNLQIMVKTWASVFTLDNVFMLLSFK